MPMLPELVAPIQSQLDAAEAELKRLEATRKSKKGNNILDMVILLR